MSPSHTFEAGQTVYLADGAMAEFVSVAADQFIVHPMLAGYEDEDPYPCKSIIQVPEVFGEPPIAAMDARVAESVAKLDALNAQIATSRTEATKAASEHSNMMARLKAQPSLRNLDLFLQGKITHAVELRMGQIKIATLKEWFDGERWTKDVQLIGIQGRADGSLGWRFSNGNSASGNASFLCTSEEEAIALAREHVEKIAEGWRKNKNQHYYLDDMATACRRWNIDVPADVEAHLRAQAIAIWTSAVERSERELEVNRARLATAKATGAS